MTTKYISKSDLQAFLLTVGNGHWLTYAISDNFVDACERNPELREIRRMAWNGPCLLVQRRIDGGLTEYIAIKSARGRKALRPDKWFFGPDDDEEKITRTKPTKKRDKKPSLVEA